MKNEKDMIKWLNNLKSDIGQPQHSQLWHYAEILDVIVKYLENTERTGWTPVSEGLPKKNGNYIVSLEDAVDTYARFFNGKWFMPLFGSIAREYGEYEVIAWQPLPEPYKGGNAE